MRNNKTFIIKGLILFLGLFIYVSAIAATTKPLIYAAWIPYWKKTTAVPDAIAHIKQLKEISPFSYEVKADGTLVDAMKINQAPWPALLQAAKDNKVKVIPSILWANGDQIQKVLSNSNKRIAHLRQIVAVVDKNNFDGIDIDYESKKADTMSYFSQLLIGLSSAMHVRGKILSCTIEPRTPPSSLYIVMPDKIEYANDYKIINKYCDEVRLMTYDQTTVDVKLNMLKRQGGLYAPVADIDWVRKVLTLATQTISPSKIMVGVPTYGYEYEVVDKTKFYDYTKLRSINYQDAIQLAKDNNAKISRNGAGELSFTYAKGTSTRLVWFSDASAIADKVKAANTFNLRGVAMFRIDGVSDPAIWDKLK